MIGLTSGERGSIEYTRERFVEELGDPRSEVTQDDLDLYDARVAALEETIAHARRQLESLLTDPFGEEVE